MKVYRIKDWDHLYENNRTRTMGEMRWVPIPNKHDGDGYNEMIDGEDGAAILGGWLGVVQVASKCRPRGTLLRATGKPHTADTIARQCRLSVKWVAMALERAASPAVEWLEVVDISEEACGCHPPDVVDVTEPHPPDGQPTMEWNGMEEKGREAGVRAREASADSTPPTLDQWLTNATFIGYDPKEAETAWHSLESMAWEKDGRPIRKWKHLQTVYRDRLAERKFKDNQRSSFPPGYVKRRPRGPNI